MDVPAYATTDPTLIVGTMMLIAFIIIALLALATYLYQAFALMTIARKIKTPNGWLAFIPIANVYLTWRMSKTPAWTIISVFTLSAIIISGLIGFSIATGTTPTPLAMGTNLVVMLLIGLLGFVVWAGYIAISSWWWWRIAEQRRYHGAFGLLLTLPMLAQIIPYIGWVFGIVPLIAIGILAWREQP